MGFLWLLNMYNSSQSRCIGGVISAWNPCRSRQNPLRLVAQFSKIALKNIWNMNMITMMRIAPCIDRRMKFKVSDILNGSQASSNVITDPFFEKSNMRSPSFTDIEARSAWWRVSNNPSDGVKRIIRANILRIEIDVRKLVWSSRRWQMDYFSNVPWQSTNQKQRD